MSGRLVHTDACRATTAKALPHTTHVQRAPNPGAVPHNLQPADVRGFSAAQVLALQHTAGNQAVSRLIAAGVQAKLSVGAAGDQLEQEADRVAQSVVSKPITGPAGAIRRRFQRQDKGVQPKPADAQGGFETDSGWEQRLQASQGGGSPLADDMRSFMEPRFGADFGDVRLHTGAEASQLNREIDAQAFTHGKDIYLGEGKYNPGTSDGKLLLAHELAHTVQQTGTVQRWAEQEHLAFGDTAARLAAQHDWSITSGKQTYTPAGVGQGPTSQMTGSQETQQQYAGLKADAARLGGQLTAALHDQQIDVPATGDIGVSHMQAGQKRFMSFGHATMLGGDYFKTAEGGGMTEMGGLAQAESVNVFDMQTRMKYIATTNTNHFWPLAGREWLKQYGEALNLAGTAGTYYRLGNKAKGDAYAESAWHYLGVAIHFLQDTFASGHQYPHALNDIDSSTMAGVVLGGGPDAKTYHDALCALPHGIPLLYGGRFHGDTTADGSDYPVVLESYHAIVHFLRRMTGKQGPNVLPPKFNPGPDTGKILDDPEAGPIWSSMLQHVKGQVETAKSKSLSGLRNMVRQTNFTTSAGTTYSAKDLKDEWDKLNDPQPGRKPSTVDELVNAALENQQNPLFSFTRGTSMTAIGMSTNATADVKIRGIIAKRGVPQLTPQQCTMIVGTLITGDVTMADGQAALSILRAQQDDAVVLHTIKELTPEQFRRLDPVTWEAFLVLWASRGSSASNPGADFVLKEKNANAARKLLAQLGTEGQKARLSPAQIDAFASLTGAPAATQ